MQMHESVAKQNLAKTEIDKNPFVSMLKAFPTAVSRKGSQHLRENNNKIGKKICQKLEKIITKSGKKYQKFLC